VAEGRLFLSSSSGGGIGSPHSFNEGEEFASFFQEKVLRFFLPLAKGGERRFRVPLGGEYPSFSSGRKKEVTPIERSGEPASFQKNASCEGGKKPGQQSGRHSIHLSGREEDWLSFSIPRREKRKNAP